MFFNSQIGGIRLEIITFPHYRVIYGKLKSPTEVFFLIKNEDH
jgi:hypothetical protein